MPDRMPTHSTPAEPASTTPYREGYGGYGHGAYGGYGQGGYGGHGQGGYSHGAYGGHGGYGGYSHGAYGATALTMPPMAVTAITRGVWPR
ncbi:hypothetical protein BZL29_4953 [Mycobacterium kansasii]|uniref:Uncharacterized protein n=1 Tax=Mycobacterium kansasii TaxID=1768 RepID=A0A1V3X1E0_MYCKA|nr:hypothetical protein BZL29_4953 [Mycobacterium kansasii]